jgi:pimeloyl-ACP methyl ester carboxylesterase
MRSARCSSWPSVINAYEIGPVLSVWSSTVADMSFLDVPGARLYYETRGRGPLLFMIGSPMDSTGFAPLAEIMAATHSVVTYDPRGVGNSTREDAEEDITPELQADDVHRLIGALGGAPLNYLGSSGGVHDRRPTGRPAPSPDNRTGNGMRAGTGTPAVTDGVTMRPAPGTRGS